MMQNRQQEFVSCGTKSMDKNTVKFFSEFIKIYNWHISRGVDISIDILPLRGYCTPGPYF